MSIYRPEVTIKRHDIHFYPQLFHKPTLANLAALLLFALRNATNVFLLNRIGVYLQTVISVVDKTF